MFARGTRVLALWLADVDLFYPAVVIASDKTQAAIQFDDGVQSTVAIADIRPLEAVRVGLRIQARWHGERLYYPGAVVEQEGAAVLIAYDDGAKEWTALSMVRVHRDHLPPD